MSNDVWDVIDAPKKGNGHGGARRGAGAKPKGHEKPQEVQEFDKARARHEQAKANLAELEFKRRSGQYIARGAVRQASAHALASVAQSLRSIPDALERKFALSPEVTEAIGVDIDAVLSTLAEEFEMMVASPDGDEDEGEAE